MLLDSPDYCNTVIAIGRATMANTHEESQNAERKYRVFQRQPQSGPQSFRSLEALSRQKKARKAGRPKLPKGEAKGYIVPVRFTVDDLKAITAAAKKSKQTISEWIRSTLDAEIQR